MQEEHWKRLEGYPDYAVSTHGRVFSLRLERLLVQRLQTERPTHNARYLQVELNTNGKRKRFDVHRLVLDAFRGSRLPGQQCRHLDSNSQNNHLSNLVWGTYEENRADWRKARRGIKLTVQQVSYIRGSTKTLRALAAELGCSKSLVHLVRRNWLWKHVASEPDPR